MSWMTPVAADGSDMWHPLGEDVLEVAVVRLDADQSETRVGDDVTHHTVHVKTRRWWVDPHHLSQWSAGEPGGGQGIAQRVAFGRTAEHLDQDGPGDVEELARRRGAQQVPAVQDDHVVADLLQLAEQVGRDQDGDVE